MESGSCVLLHLPALQTNTHFRVQLPLSALVSVLSTGGINKSIASVLVDRSVLGWQCCVQLVGVQ